MNDTYGHDVGDRVLEEFSAIMTDSLDTVVCRWGGEEFVAIIPDGKISDEMLDTVRIRVQSNAFVEDIGLHITVSAGVCRENGASVKDIDKIITNADKALYEVKNSGRNKIVHHEVSAAAAE